MSEGVRDRGREGGRKETALSSALRHRRDLEWETGERGRQREANSLS